MSFVVSYFTDSSQLDKAIQEMANTKFASCDWQVLEPSTDKPDLSPVQIPLSMPAVAVGSDYAAPMLVDTDFSNLPFGISLDQKEASYFNRMLSRGGALLVINEVTEEDETQLVRHLNHYGGLTTKDM